MEFKLKAEFIELDNLLKVLELTVSGAQAKQEILSGLVKVNGVVESRIRRKLYPGDCVEFGGQKISIIS
ncbi:MAG: RNA-binding S4 domain-containing protein [Candidatus Omnitrophica bacterium]|jgi:ribosome-associated protein|nr:RNA-binding S4 domain-containing protein [Candidatus Omnitrophota bacterium]MDD5252723.1 RNA-binding S4 domain-containing protein [Candidatus Omnitrophota bacterium]